MAAAPGYQQQAGGYPAMQMQMPPGYEQMHAKSQGGVYR